MFSFINSVRFDVLADVTMMVVPCNVVPRGLHTCIDILRKPDFYTMSVGDFKVVVNKKMEKIYLDFVTNSLNRVENICRYCFIMKVWGFGQIFGLECLEILFN
jgi:hypothetical protein